jgi:hypothetical protein
MTKLSSILVALVLLAVPASLFAKKDPIVTITATDTIKGDVSFNTVQVIDLRKDKSNIGKLNQYMGKRVILTKDSLPANLQQLVHTMLSSATSLSARDLLVVVHDLQLQDFVREQPMISTLQLNIDFYLGENGAYMPVPGLDSLYEMHKGKRALDFITAACGYIITEKIKEIAAIPTPAVTEPKTIAAILSFEEDTKRNIPIYHEPAKDGVYYTYGQFKNNTPAETSVHHERYFAGDAHVDRFYLSSAEKKKEKDLAYSNCFAIYFEGKWYKRYTENTFREMKLIDGDFYYYDILKGLKIEDYSSVAAAGMPFGLIGALAATGVALAFQEGQRGKPREYHDALFRMKIVPETGAGRKLERIR